MNKKRFFIGYIIMFCIVMFSNANAQPPNDKESARVFVQKFYDWYVPLWNRPIKAKKNAPSDDILAINQKRDYFDEQLRKALIEDDVAQSKAKGEIVGLESDPFLDAQDTGYGYQAGNVKQEGNKFLVDVHYDSSEKSKKEILSGKKYLIAEVVKANGSWKFTNFMYIYPKGQENLLHMLDGLRKDRDKMTK